MFPMKKLSRARNFNAAPLSMSATGYEVLSNAEERAKAGSGTKSLPLKTPALMPAETIYTASAREEAAVATYFGAAITDSGERLSCRRYISLSKSLPRLSGREENPRLFTLSRS